MKHLTVQMMAYDKLVQCPPVSAWVSCNHALSQGTEVELQSCHGEANLPVSCLSRSHLM